MAADDVQGAAVLEKAKAAFVAGNYREAARLVRPQLNAKESAQRDSAAQLLAPLSIDPVMIVIYGLCLTVLGWASVSYLQ